MSFPAFIARRTASGAGERANKDSFLNELCDVLGVKLARKPEPCGPPDGIDEGGSVEGEENFLSLRFSPKPSLVPGVCQAMRLPALTPGKEEV
jgi:hypothetical protein